MKRSRPLCGSSVDERQLEPVVLLLLPQINVNFKREGKNGTATKKSTLLPVIAAIMED